MSKSRFIKGNLRRSDYFRVVLTDTAPYEMPLIVSNDGFYKNLAALGEAPQAVREVIAKIVTENHEKYTMSFRYKVKKDRDTLRLLSLPHPAAQYRIVQFYEKYDALIPYYCGRGSFSLRRPERNGSSFFFRTNQSDQNQYRNDKVDLEELDRFIKNPASFFAYSGVERLYKFFGSADFLRLEKKFSQMSMMDISKCFSSIYSHTISWAVKTSDHSKNHTHVNSFGNDFDRLMMWMNYGETNGICIGPEVSRIFAEVILGRIDLSISQQCAQIGIVNGVHYEIRRYVDDYMVFCSSTEVEKEVHKIIEERLSEYNLHLNSAKTDHYQRPFLTPKSHIINLTKEKLHEFFLGFIDVNERNLIPKKIYRRDALIRSLINAIKSVCHQQAAGYDMIANYVISSLVKRVEKLVDGYSEAVKLKQDASMYPPALMCLLEASLFFYTVDPSVAASFNVGRAIIIIWRFLERELPGEKPSASGQIQRWVSQLVRQHQPDEKFEHRAKVPVEFLNIILATCEIEGAGDMDERLLREAAFGGKESEYFSLVSCLFYMKDKPSYSSLRREVQLVLDKRLGDCRRVLLQAHDAHLVLDLLACPYLDIAFRTKLLGRLRSALSLEARTNTERQSDVLYIQAHPWFVQWDRLDILTMIKKKELSSVY